MLAHTYVVNQPPDIGHLDDVPSRLTRDDEAIGKTTRRQAQERMTEQMETTNRLRNDARVQLIDATELDDEQFNDLISNIDPRSSIFPIICGLMLLLALAMLT
jgi:hypothetical protein